jgi:putative membrane protein
MRLRASDIASKLAAGRLREHLRPSDLREKWEERREGISERAREAWESRPRWLRSERAREAWENRPEWLRSRDWYEEEVEAKNVLKGALAGAIGGLVGAWAMAKAKNLIQRPGARRREARWTKREARPVREYTYVGTGERESERFGRGESVGEPGEWRSEQWRIAEEEPATEKLAHNISRRVLRRDLSQRGKRIGGQVVHYGYGATMGAIYGGAAEVAPRVTAGLGMPAGALMWAVGDEIAVPALKLSKPPREYSLSQHATYLGMHLVYGATTELVRRALRRMMG